MFHPEDGELLDVVNQNDEVVGTIKRGDMMQLKNTPGRYLRTVEIFIQRPDGKIYLPRRSKEKKIAPGGLDISVAGHVLSGESYDEACIRETKEEVGISTSIDRFTLIATVDPSATLFYFRKVYLLRTDQPPVLSPEHTEAVWVEPAEMAKTVAADVPTKEVLAEDIPILLDYLQAYQN